MSESLQHTIERAVILCENSSISVSDLGDLSKHSLQENMSDLSNSGNLEDNMEKRTIELALQRYRGNISQTALELGIFPEQLYTGEWRNMDFNLFRKNCLRVYCNLFVIWRSTYCLFTVIFYYSSLLLFVLCFYQIYLLIQNTGCGSQAAGAFSFDCAC
ncbi:MAG: helix-turn-helix domain-containing protein [Bacteroidia bacterium]